MATATPAADPSGRRATRRSLLSLHEAVANAEAREGWQPGAPLGAWPGRDRTGQPRVTSGADGCVVALSLAHCDLPLTVGGLVGLLRTLPAAADGEDGARRLSETLETLDLQSNERLTGRLEALFEGLPALRSVNLKRCSKIEGNLSSVAAAAVAGRLTALDLSRCRNIAGDLQSLSGAVHLAELDLYHCSAVTGRLSSLSALRRLRKLGLSKLVAVVGCLGDVSALHDLEILNLSHCKHVTGDLTELAPLTKLAHVWLLGTGVAGDQGLLPLALCSRLQRLDVSGLPLTGPIPTSLTQVKNLELKIIGTQLRSELRMVSVDVAQYPLYVVPTAKLLELERIPPHEEAVKMDLLM